MPYWLLSFYCWDWVGKCQKKTIEHASSKKFFSFNENENDILRLNDFLDFIYIVFTVVFIIYFALVFTVINFANFYFWIIKLSVPSSKIMKENAFFHLFPPPPRNFFWPFLLLQAGRSTKIPPSLCEGNNMPKGSSQNSIRYSNDFKETNSRRSYSSWYFQWG